MSKLILFTLAASLPVAASAQTAVPAARFEAIELRGGGTVTVRHGTVQRVTLYRGNLEVSRIEVQRDGGGDPKLVIEACRSSCRNYDLRVEIVTPDLDAIAIRGGGTVRVEGRFPARAALALAVTGGGSLDARGLPAGSVATAVNGGGSIRTAATVNLVASVKGGGAILYSGDPQVVSSVRGGGAVTRLR
ncbi:GIN domain-containing protein [Allosphingosinicella sp.]|jgi:hypothetical protein|uniref:GIN domain-containing protein n=1 Tax=Allosphingosinicella sp. TaxID=2823234 RepID=UPI002EEA93D0